MIPRIWRAHYLSLFTPQPNVLRRMYAVQPSIHHKPTPEPVPGGPERRQDRSSSPSSEEVSSNRRDDTNNNPNRPLTSAEKSNVHAGHARFIAEADQQDNWREGVGNAKRGGDEAQGEEIKGLAKGQGKLSPTSTHLFKLILSLPMLGSPSHHAARQSPPTVFLLHPSQPLSHVSRLIQSSLPHHRDHDGGPRNLAPPYPSISFQSAPPDASTSSSSGSSSASPAATVPPEPEEGDEYSTPPKTTQSSDDGHVQWSDSTDIGDFVKEAARSTEFFVVLTPPSGSKSILGPSPSDKHKEPDSASSTSSNPGSSHEPKPWVIPVSVPTFEDRTKFLRRRLGMIQSELKEMQTIKDACDADAHRGAKRLAIGGFGLLVTYWITVFRLTFFTSLGWDVMEPVTYLTEFLFILAGYMWFLYQGREVSYSSILNRSVSTRRQNLYASRGLDIDRWGDLVTESKALKREIERIREDYEAGWKESTKEENRNEAAREEKADEDSRKTSSGGGMMVGTEEAAASRPKREDDVVESRRKEISQEQERKNEL